MIDEVRISNSARSADWMKASYLSETDSLITFGAAETAFVYVADTNNNRIQKYDASGNFSAVWGSYGSGNASLATPKGVVVSGNGSVYVVDSNSNHILKFTGTGNYSTSWGSYGNNTGQFAYPYGIAVGPDGSIYIADKDNNRVQKFTGTGNYTTGWGGYGNVTGNFNSPTGIAVDNSSYVYVVDTNNNRVQKFSPASQSPSPVTNYDYNILGNLVQVTDATGNVTTISYDWLSRKTAMVDPDMGGWGYAYDKNGNLATQTDNKSQTITFTYDALNRLKGKSYPAGANMTNVTYSYDSGTYGKGQRTSMVDAGGNTTYQYDQRGRLVTENRTFTGDNATYVTRYGYGGADRIIWIIYPTGENVTQTYNGRGLVSTLSGNVSGNLVTSTYYNTLGQITEINLNNGLRTTFGYWGMGGAYDTTGGYYGRLWEIKTLPQAGGTALMDVQHIWDAGGNLASRTDALVSQTETFAYDTINRLASVTGPYSENYTYNAIGNILSKNGVSYTYGSKPHAVTSFGSTNYTYDNNGNMLTRGSQNITWDAENRPVSITLGGGNNTGSWWSTNWTIRNKLTFNTTSIGANLTSFPVLVHLTSSNFNFGYAQVDGGDIRFIDADNTTVLDYEIEKWTGSEAWVWVRVPVLTGNSTIDFVWMYYSNANAANGWNPSGVWDNNHTMVQHLEETDIDGGTGDIKDTTTNNNHGTTHGMNTADQVAAKVNGGFDFDGVDDYVSVPDSDAWMLGNFTISLWVKANSWSGSSWTRAFVGQDAGGGETNKWFFSYSGATLFMVNTAGDNNGGTYVQGNSWTAQTGIWYHVGITRLGDNFTFYRDGATDGSPTNSHTIPNVNAPLTLAWAEGSPTFNGIMDEVRISNTARSTDWMKASYLSDTGALISFGTSETANFATYVYDGDGNRVKQTGNGETILYVNKYYEKNLTTGNVTTYYYSGDRRIAEREASTLRYFHQDRLSSTSLMTDSSGGSLGTLKHYPFGASRSGSVPTDIQFTGQKLDATDLYYYGARYYDSNIGRFISPDTFMLDPSNPQGLNRYSYVFNNPLMYNDPSGNWPPFVDKLINKGKEIAHQGINAIKDPVSRGIEAAKKGLEVAKSEVIETYNAAKVSVEQTALHAVGIDKIIDVGFSGSDQPVRIWVASNSGLNIINRVLDVFGTDTEGLTPGSHTILLRENASDTTLKHEFIHIEQARELDQQGESYLGTYVGQYVSGLMNLGPDDAYLYHPMEWEAREKAGQLQPAGPPTYWYEDIFEFW